MIYDFSLFPEMNTGFLIIPKPSQELVICSEIYDRFCAAIYMASRISEKSGKYMINESAKHCAYVRATLAEYSSIEDCIKQIYPSFKNSGYEIKDSKNPAFHVLKLLRNYNIHLSENTLSSKKISIALASEPDKEYENTVLFIDSLSVDNIMKLRSAKYYTRDEVADFVSILDSKQHEFGISQLLMRIVVDYSECISSFMRRP